MLHFLPPGGLPATASISHNSISPKLLEFNTQIFPKPTGNERPSIFLQGRTWKSVCPIVVLRKPQSLSTFYQCSSAATEQRYTKITCMDLCLYMTTISSWLLRLLLGELYSPSGHSCDTSSGNCFATSCLSWRPVSKAWTGPGTRPCSTTAPHSGHLQLSCQITSKKNVGLLTVKKLQ